MTEQKTPQLTPEEARDEAMVSAAFRHLLDTYLASNHRRKVDLITKAFNFARQAHKGVRRLSGEPYILHPIAVAQIVAEEIGLGSTSICAALLHDVEEDTDYTNEDLANLFGQKIANIVEGLTKISGGIFGERASLQAETFKKLLLTMSDDIRVILIKIADRLHNMRTLQSMRPSKQYKIAGETLYIFAPIADRLGLNKIKTELENLSFRYEHPDEFARVERLLADTQPEREKAIDNFTPAIRRMLDRQGVQYTLSSRIKSPYSIWMKMQNKHVPFEEIFDILAIRIVFVPKDRENEEGEAFAIYAGLTKLYKPHPTRFRDWLSTPKANGYQALHNTFMSEQGKWIEVQIRSDRMDDIAEQGFAAHWKYKDAGAAYDENELDKWLDSIREILDDPQPDTLDLLDSIKLNLFSSEILVFTPKGDIKTMPAGSTVLDFAFSIHSFVGAHCFGAKVNHKLVPLSYELKSGDQVEIMTRDAQRVQAEWLTFVTTAKARGKIQAALRREARERQQQGESLYADFLRRHDIERADLIADKLAAFHRLDSRDEFYQLIGEGQLQLGEADLDHLRGKSQKKSWRRLLGGFLGKRRDAAGEEEEADRSAEAFVKNINRKKTLYIDEDVLGKCVCAPCCRPIPGDDVMGFITQKGTLEIHKRSCETGIRLKTRYGNNIIAAEWDTHRRRHFDATIYIKGVDAHGVLYSIADVLQAQSEFIVKRITLESRDGIFEGNFDISVYDTSDIVTVCAALRRLPHISHAVRTDK